MADQTDHFTRFDNQINIAGHGTGTVTETGLAQLKPAFTLAEVHRVGRFRHAGNVVEYVEDPLGTSGGFLCHRNNAAHRVETQIKTADVGKEGGQHADRDVVFGNLPDTKSPDDEQADFGEQRDRRRK